jgi:sec-independent protein translocase protein TatA
VVPRLGFWEILIIAFVILLLFGANRIPEMMRGLAKGLRGFKDEMRAEDKPSGSAQDRPEGQQAEEKPKAT